MINVGPRNLKQGEKKWDPVKLGCKKHRDGRGEFSSLRSSYPERGRSRSSKSAHNFSFVSSIVIHLHSSLLQFSVSEPQFFPPIIIVNLFPTLCIFSRKQDLEKRIDC
ncbi:hypothetical protein MIMGU_mgv11b014066mg [Erythranthe guttata]|uniref:Uncharacterized protein n=1 Tax=Erythranthe guttata TaxID=4155 RepID=A0A022QNP9_ERYGU|nr:hypothetical protein MIMGU_mgv11b014066mg [Erythranthe guttata]